MPDKINCLVVDDEPAALDLLKRYVERTPFLHLLGTCSNGLEVLQYIEQHKAPDLIFLDIQMPELNGMALSKNMPTSTKIIFTTAFDQYAIDGYKVNALDYLLKPIDYAEFLSAAGKAKDWFHVKESKHAGSNSPEPTVKDYIFLRSEYKQLKIELSSIIYIEGLKDYAKIHLSGEQAPILSLISLKKLEEELPPTLFMRVHRSYIVALNKIEQIERNQIILKDKRITVAEQYRQAFHQFVNQKSL